MLVVLVFVCVGGSPSLKWLFSIISRVSSGVSGRSLNWIVLPSSLLAYMIGYLHGNIVTIMLLKKV